MTTFVLALLAAGTAVFGQSTIPRSDSVRPGVGGVLQGSNIFVPAERMESVDPDAKLAPGDELTVEIEQDREGGFQKIVSATGEIRMDPGGAVKVAGKTTGEAAADIKRMLEKDYYYTATVKISLDRRSRQMVKAGSISLGGDVKTVGQLDLEAGQRLTVSEAILKAGGFTPFADSRHIQVTRTEGGGTKSFTLDVKQIIEKGRVDLDVPVVDGDRIFVPKARIVF